MKASFKSIGAYVPESVMTNEDFVKIIDTTDEWITKRTGIKERRVAKEETTSDLGYKASLLAIERANIDIKDIDCVICATISPDYLSMPSTACLIAHKLGIKDVMAFDISAACTGFIYLLNIAKSFIESGMKKNILIVGAEKLSSIIDYSDRTTCFLFGDGAGAAIIGTTDDDKKSILDVHTASDGGHQDLLKTPHATNEKLAFMQMKGNETFKIAVRTLTNDVKDILEKNSILADEVKYFIPHQANYRIIKAVGDALKFDEDKVVVTVNKYGNTSGASIPMAINDMYESGKLQNGDLMLLDAFGGGLTWGSSLVYFDGE
jgi:3-oxoacyl-[acyl-carrier-protein] synthase-3